MSLSFIKLMTNKCIRHTLHKVDGLRFPNYFFYLCFVKYATQKNVFFFVQFVPKIQIKILLDDVYCQIRD